MGKCACTEGWEGNACECPKSNQTCLDSKGVSRSRNGVLGSDGLGWCYQTSELVWLLCLRRVSATGEVNVCVASARVQTLISQ